MTKYIKLLSILLTVLVLSITTQAEKINIFHNNPNAKIMLNGKLYPTNALYDYDVLPGTHLVKVVIDGSVVYSKVVPVPKGEVTTVDANTFIQVEESQIPNQGASQEELKRLKQTQGDFGVGFQFASVSGLSLKKFFGPFGVQVAGWYYSGGEDTFSSVNTRFLYVLKEKLLKVDTPISLYTGLGYGHTLNDDLLELRNDDIYEVFLGVEHPVNFGFISYNIVFREFNIDYERFSSGEKKSSQTGFTFNLGYHYYF